MLLVVVQEFPVVLIGISVLLPEPLSRGKEYEPASLEDPVSLSVPILPCLVLQSPAYSREHCVVEQLDDMEIVIDYGDMWPVLPECAVVLRIHVHGNGLYPSHPFRTNEMEEVLCLLLPLAFLDEYDIAGIQVRDYGGIPVPIMQQELINADMLGGSGPVAVISVHQVFPVHAEQDSRMYAEVSRDAREGLSQVQPCLHPPAKT